MKILLLHTEYNDTLRTTLKSLIENNFPKPKLVKGVIRDDKISKIVMDGWKKILPKIGDDEDILLMEDDVEVKIDYKKIKIEHRDRPTFVFYQKKLKEEGSYASMNTHYIVGTQGVFIPKEIKKEFTENLLQARSMHFDRWLSARNQYATLGNPKEYGLEIRKKKGR